MKEVSEIEYIEFKNRLIFDSKNDDINILNKPDNLETILTNSPIVYNDEVIGVITYAQNRPNTSLYYGNICIYKDLLEKLSDIKIEYGNKIEIVNQELKYNNSKDSNIFLTNIISHIKIHKKSEISEVINCD